MKRGLAIVLAAGGSTRMGRDKALLPWVDGQPLLAWMRQALEDGGWCVAVVACPKNESNLTEIMGEKNVVLNPDPAAGKAGSIRCGLAHWRGADGPLLITGVDQPRETDVYAVMLEAALEYPAGICVPAQGTHRGHPVVFGGETRDLAESVSDQSQGLRGVLDAAKDRVWRLPIDHWPWDLNTPEAYEVALEQARRGME